jgi:hypothetical protein
MKRSIQLLLSAFMLTLPLAGAKAQSATGLPPGLISWWRAEGNTADETGTHPGTARGALSYTNGQVGQCFVLDGASGAVELGGGWFNLQQFTWSLWVNPGDGQMAYADLIDNNHSTSVSWPIQYQNYNDGLITRWQWGPNGGGLVNFDLQNGAWQHLVVARDGVNGTTVYLNGTPVGTNGASYGPIPYDGSEFLYLGRHAIFGRYFHGLVDELMVFDRALTATEVSSLYANQSRPTLDIHRQLDGVIVSWPAPSEGWRLHATTDLLPSGSVWTEIPPPYETNGAIISVALTNSAATGNQFFRLHKP